MGALVHSACLTATDNYLLGDNCYAQEAENKLKKNRQEFELRSREKQQLEADREECIKVSEERRPYRRAYSLDSGPSVS